YGDPHCQSFSGQSDTWVVCDSRVVKGQTSQCTESKAMCLKQRDNLGATCVWQPNPSGQNWNIGLQGSQCIFSSKQHPPNMTMYKADNFSLELILGERAIIQSIAIQDRNSGNGYYLSAADCLQPVEFPWRATPLAKSAPTNPSWLPYSFRKGVLSGGDVLW